jgi:hypothetical protein
MSATGKFDSVTAHEVDSHLEVFYAEKVNGEFERVLGIFSGA